MEYTLISLESKEDRTAFFDWYKRIFSKMTFREDNCQDRVVKTAFFAGLKFERESRNDIKKKLPVL